MMLVRPSVNKGVETHSSVTNKFATCTRLSPSKHLFVTCSTIGSTQKSGVTVHMADETDI